MSVRALYLDPEDNLSGHTDSSFDMGSGNERTHVCWGCMDLRGMRHPPCKDGRCDCSCHYSWRGKLHLVRDVRESFWDDWVKG